MTARSLLIIAFVGAGCGTGGLGQVSVLRDCAAGDGGCRRVGPLAPLAVGAVFYPVIGAELPGTTTPALALRSADPRIVEVDGGAMIARAPGVTAVMIAVDSGAVFDLLHVWVAQATAVTIERDTGERLADRLDLVAGEELRLQPAVWARGQRLEGASALEWTLECAAECPIALLRDGSPDRRRLRARGAGAATVVLAGLGLSQRLAIEVVP